MLDLTKPGVAMAPQMDHPYIRRFDLLSAETGKYLGALIQFMDSTWDDVYSKKTPTLKLFIAGDPKDKNGARTVHLDMSPRHAGNITGDSRIDIVRFGTTISQVDFDVLVANKWAEPYHRDPLDYEIGEWKRGLKKPLD